MSSTRCRRAIMTAVSFLRTVEIATGEEIGHPFDAPAVAAMRAARQVLRFGRGVTVFVGDNGSGKSTLLEAIAVHQGLNPEGGSRSMRFETRGDTVSSLYRHLRVNRAARVPRDAFFLRAESYFNVATAIEGYDDPDRTLTRGYGGSPHERSHGESFLDLVAHRFGPHGLYLLDEPEAALSAHGQLQLLVRIHDLVAAGSQFVLATHSPLLMAYPGATLYEFGAGGIAPATWADIDTVRITADFLAHPAEFLGDLFGDE